MANPLQNQELLPGFDTNQELTKLRKKFGAYSADTVRSLKEAWNDPIRAYNNLQGEPTDDNLVHVALYKWAGPPGPEKQKLISTLEKYPGEKQKIQDFAQWILREKGIATIKLYRAGMELSDNTTLKAWSSVSEDESVVRQAFSQGHSPNPGYIIGIDVPVENIFTFYDAHPGFREHLPEKEFILNERGITNCRLVSFNGHEPSTEEREKILKFMPELKQ